MPSNVGVQIIGAPRRHSLCWFHVDTSLLVSQTDGRLLFLTQMDPLYLILPYLIKSGIEVRSKNH